MSASTIHTIFEMLNNIKVYHWRTKKYSEHIATDNLHTILSTLFDRLVEVYLNDENNVPSSIASVDIMNLPSKEFVSYLRHCISIFNKDPIFTKRSDLANIRDEIIAEINKVLYLLQLQ